MNDGTIDIQDIPENAWLPACSRVASKISMPNAKYSPFVSNKNKRLPSETKGLRLLQAFMEYRDSDGTTKLGRVKLDTQSNDVTPFPT